jgi:hypothetical protein
MKTTRNVYPILREAKVISAADPEKLGRVQLKVYPELSDIPDDDCPWCFPHTGGIHGKSFGVPLTDQVITCVVWNRYWNEITFLPFTITKPAGHLFDDWMKNQRTEIGDMETDPEEEHLAVEHFEDDFTVFHDTKNKQHGFLHSSGTYALIDKDGGIHLNSVKELILHDAEGNVECTVNAQNGDIRLKIKGKYDKEIGGEQNSENKDNVTDIYKKDWTISVEGNLTANVTGTAVIKSEGEATVESAETLIIKGMTMLQLKGESVAMNGAPEPTGEGPFCALPFCLATGAEHSGSIVIGAS